MVYHKQLVGVVEVWELLRWAADRFHFGFWSSRDEDMLMFQCGTLMSVTSEINTQPLL